MALSRAIKESIAAEMTRQSVSQRELARRLGVPQNYLWSRLSTSEKAVMEFTPSEIEQIAEVLNVPVGKLLPRTAVKS